MKVSNGTALLVGGLVAVVASAIKGKVDAARAFQYTIEGTPSVSYQDAQVVLCIPVGISNKANEQFTIHRVYGQAMVNSAFIGDFETPAGFVIGPAGRASVKVVLTVFLTNAVTSLISAIVQGAKDTTLSLQGTVVTSLKDISFTVAKTF